jgi:hypothetical protein
MAKDLRNFSEFLEANRRTEYYNRIPPFLFTSYSTHLTHIPPFEVGRVIAKLFNGNIRFSQISD